MPGHLRYNDALNVAYALFTDDLYRGATACAGAYEKLPAYNEGAKLYALWQELDRELADGEEWKMVDAFAERLGISDWYAWRHDTYLDPPSSE